ncbi:MAG: septum formation initiator family protein [Bacteroidetes bacterium]|nr:septum formation initiator family protein [Bacteroidota bacterium]
MFKRIFNFFKNKYVITIIFFVVWMLFFDKNNLIQQIEMRQKLHQLENDKKYYTEEIIKDHQASQELLTSPEALEKLGREEYLMKRDSEDVFLIVREPQIKK